MSNRLSFLPVAMVVVMFSGCATMSSDECVTSDWSTIGYEDGARGYTTQRIGQHRKACAKHGVTPDLTAYQRGREQGLQEYCQPNRGFNVGVNGGQYHGVCAVNVEADFLDAYNTGYQLYALRADVNRANNAIHSNERELVRIEKSVRAKEAALISDSTTQADRVILLADLKDLSERAGAIEAEIKDLYDVRARAEVQLEQYQVLVADLGY